MHPRRRRQQKASIVKLRDKRNGLMVEEPVQVEEVVVQVVEEPIVEVISEESVSLEEPVLITEEQSSEEDLDVEHFSEEDR